jgi:hypothetical protein
VARIVKRSVTRVRRVERRALKRLRRLSASSSCESSGSSGSSNGSSVYATYGPGGTTAQGAPASEEAGFTPVIDPERSGGSSDTGIGRKFPRQETQPNVVPPPSTGLPHLARPGGGPGIAPIVGLALLLAVGAIAITGVRKGWPGFG